MFTLIERLYDDDPAAAGGGDPAKPVADPQADAAAKITELESKLSQGDQRHQQLQQQLAEMRQALQRPSGGNGDVERKRALNERMWQTLQNDPSELLTTQEAIAWRAAQAAVAASRGQNVDRDKAFARSTVKESDPELFTKYGPEIEAYIATTWPNNPDALTTQSTWQVAADAIRGRHAKELYSKQTPGADPGSPGKPSPRSMAKAKDDDGEPLKEDEKVAQEEIFGISEAEYKKHKRVYREQRDRKTLLGRKMLQSPLAKEGYIDQNRTYSGFANPHFGKWRPLMTFDSEVQKPRHPEKANA
jgi:hypothetical protein